MSPAWLVTALALAVTAVALPAMAHGPGDDVNARPDPTMTCHVGVYRLEDGSWVDVAPVVNKGLQWRRLDGSIARMTLNAEGLWGSTRGWTNRVEGPQPQLGTCDEGRINFEGQTGIRMDLDAWDTTFVGYGGTSLNGRLILPPGGGPVPIMVEVHGSEGANALDFNAFQRLAPASGVGVFVYAKRGSGGSRGRYTQDFNILATDAVAAVAEARRLAGNRAERVGLHGGSQAGWISPLAASRTPVDFVIVDYGLAYSPLSQESDQVFQDLRAKGWGPDVLQMASEITDAAGAFVASNGEVGFDGLATVRAKYRAEPWFADVQGDFTAMVLNTPDMQLTATLPHFDVATSWNYDPLPVLSTLNTPMLWIQAGNDTKAPSEATLQRLVNLSAQGRPITVLEYPDTDHGIFLFETTPDGRRTSLGNAPGYFQAVLDWARTGRLDGMYGNGRLMARGVSTGAASGPVR